MKNEIICVIYMSHFEWTIKISLILSHTVPNMPIKIILKTPSFSDFYFSTLDVREIERLGRRWCRFWGWWSLGGTLSQSKHMKIRPIRERAQSINLKIHLRNNYSITLVKNWKDFYCVESKENCLNALYLRKYWYQVACHKRN